MRVLSIYYLLVLMCAYLSFSIFILNPVYILGFLLVFLGFVHIDLYRVDKGILIYFSYFLLTFLCFLLGIYYFFSKVKEGVILSSILYLYCVLIGMQAIVFGSKLDIMDRRKVYQKIFNFLIIFVFFDFISRLLNSGGFSTNFYDYKHGWFYFDSNFTGLIVALFLMFAIFLKKQQVFNLGTLKFIILFMLLLLTFSRAAIFSFLVSFFLLRYTGKYIILYATLFSVCAIYIFYNMVNQYISGENFIGIDGSFNTKFYLISLAIDNYSELSYVNKLFGIGLANFAYYTDIFAHNMLITLIYEFGIVGSILFLFFLIMMYIKIGRDVLYLYFPLFIGGFSLFSAYMPFFFILLASMYVETYYLKK